MKHIHILFQIFAGITICLSISVQPVSAKNQTDDTKSPKVSINADKNEIILNRAIINKSNNYDCKVVKLKDIIFNNGFEQSKHYLSAFNDLDLSLYSYEMIKQALIVKVEEINHELNFKSKEHLLTQK